MISSEKARISIYGMYLFEPTLFANLLIPQTHTTPPANAFDKDTFVDNLVCELAEMEVLYPDTDFMKVMIGKWSTKELPVWQKLYDTTVLDYNPIWNKDGTVTETRNLAGTDYQSGSSSQTYGKTETETDARATDHSISGYNSSTLQPNTKDQNSGTDTVAQSGTDTINHGLKHNTSDTGTITRVETGNIGITTTQQMIEEERKVSLFNIQDVMIKSFKDRFCILTY